MSYFQFSWMLGNLERMRHADWADGLAAWMRSQLAAPDAGGEPADDLVAVVDDGAGGPQRENRTRFRPARLEPRNTTLGGQAGAWQPNFRKVAPLSKDVADTTAEHGEQLDLQALTAELALLHCLSPW